MVKDDAKTIAAWVSIGAMVVIAFSAQAIAADARNKARDEVQDKEITSIRLDVREIKTDMGNLKDDVSDIKCYMKEQGNVNTRIINWLENMEKGKNDRKTIS